MATMATVTARPCSACGRSRGAWRGPCSRRIERSGRAAGAKRRALRGPGSDDDEDEMGEALIEKLRAAEEEAAALRRKLKLSQKEGGSNKPSTADGGDEIKRPKRRVDGQSGRETFFSGGNETWLKETQTNFFTGDAPSELETGQGQGVSPEDQAVVGRRLLVGLLVTGATVGFSLIPTEKLDIFSPANQPLENYLDSILSSYEQYASIEDALTYGQWQASEISIKRLLGPPGNLKQNMMAVAKLTEDRKVAEKLRQYTRECVDYLSQVDYNAYFDTLVKPSGKQQQEFTGFSIQSLQTSKKKLDSFLALLPRDKVEASRSQLNIATSEPTAPSDGGSGDGGDSPPPPGDTL